MWIFFKECSSAAIETYNTYKQAPAEEAWSLTWPPALSATIFAIILISLPSMVADLMTKNRKNWYSRFCDKVCVLSMTLIPTCMLIVGITAQTALFWQNGVRFEDIPVLLFTIGAVGLVFLFIAVWIRTLRKTFFKKQARVIPFIKKEKIDWQKNAIDVDYTEILNQHSDRT
jgi:hypothetical protein